METRTTEKFGSGAAAVTAFAALVAVEYSGGSYDAWDFLIAIVVLFTVYANWSEVQRDQPTFLLCCLSIGVAFAVLCAIGLSVMGMEQYLDWPLKQVNLTFCIAIGFALAIATFGKRR